MSRRTDARLQDIAAACEAISRHIGWLDASDEIVFNAIGVRLIEIGEAVKDLSDEFVALKPDIPWTDIARMRDHLADRYVDTTHAIVETTARHDVPLLAAAVRRLTDHGSSPREPRHD